MSAKGPDSGSGIDFASFFQSTNEAFNTATINSAFEQIQRAQVVQAGSEVKPGDRQKFPAIMNRAVEEIRLSEGRATMSPEELHSLLSRQYDQAYNYVIPKTEDIIRLDEHDQLIANPASTEPMRRSLIFTRLQEGKNPVRDFRADLSVTFQVTQHNGENRIVIQTQVNDAQPMTSYDPEMLLYSVISQVKEQDIRETYVLLPYPHTDREKRTIQSKTLIILTPEQEGKLRDLLRGYFVDKLGRKS
jgi:hypothetical protein